jgi:hypothetical protein
LFTGFFLYGETDQHHRHDKKPADVWFLADEVELSNDITIAVLDHSDEEKNGSGKVWTK